MTWPLVLQANKVDAAKVELLKVDPAALAPMLAAGRIAPSNWLTTCPGFERSLAEAGQEAEGDPVVDYGFEGYGLSLSRRTR